LPALLPQPYAWPLAVLVDEDHAGGLQRSADRREIARYRGPASVLEIDDCIARNDRPTPLARSSANTL
jgi:hypothetical protein